MEKKVWFAPLGTENLGESEIGGKAFFLGRMIQANLPVPPGFVLLRSPESETEWQEIMTSWEHINRPKLAVRSSAVGEDSSNLSFAGQNLSFLDVDETNIRKAVEDCFNSIKRTASLAYRKHFTNENEITSSDEKGPKMAVILQTMVEAKFSGVYFSQDPREEKPGWLLEVISGFGEELVSGHQTPHQFHQGTVTEINGPGIKGWSSQDINKVADLGKKVEELVHFSLDMEWSRDSDGKFWILQARPITSLEKTTDLKNEISKELKRLAAIHSPKTFWDCRTFAEWTGTQSTLTFSLWKKAFSSSGAFAKALSRLGYLGSSSRETHAKAGVLELVFGHAYVNMSYLSELYFGSAAPLNSGVSDPGQPHLQLSKHKMTMSDLLHLPGAAIRMVSVAWKIQTSRTQILNECREKLKEAEAFRIKTLPTLNANNPTKYNLIDTAELKSQLRFQAHFFSEKLLEHSFLLIILVESTLQNLKGALSKIQSPDVAEETLKRWMGTKVHTLSLQMDQKFAEACKEPKTQASFLELYGHRGPGELELSRPRWAELGLLAFPKMKEYKSSEHEAAPSQSNPIKINQAEDDLTKLPGVYGTLVRQEWELFREMLELRETWKNELLKNYSDIRWICLELGTRLTLGDGIFWLKLHELEKLLETKQKLSTATALKLIERRKKRSKAFSRISLPPYFSLEEIENIILGKGNDKSDVLKGDGLSAGVAFGEVRVVTQPESTDISNWPENVILVAEATDPGWTPLFLKAKGIIVEKGGVLSHCAVVAREMGLPVVSGILSCHLKFKDGEHVWLDGSTGSIRKA